MTENNEIPAAIEGVLEGTANPQYHGDLDKQLNRSVTLLATDVPGYLFALSSTNDQGLQVQPIDYRDALPEHRPVRVVGEREVSELASFKDELLRKPLTEESTLWANEATQRVTVIYDDHTGTIEGGAIANHRRDRLALQLRVDEEWEAWHALSGNYLGQEEFGDALEELIHTVIEPDQADLMEIVESVRVTTGATFESAIRRQDGQQHIAYKEENTTTAGRNQHLEIPQTITIAIRRFEGYEQKYELTAWFRLRVVNGQLKLCVKLKPTRKIELAAWSDLREDLHEFSGRPVFATRTGQGNY